MDKPARAASAVIRDIHAQRESKVPLEEAKDGRPAKAVTIRRPPEGELWMLAGGRIEVEHVCRYTVGWSGFHECDVIDGGAEDALEFSPELFREVVIDRADWTNKIAQGLAAAIEAHAARRKAAAGNS
jgi:hypothetical protein